MSYLSLRALAIELGIKFDGRSLSDA